jgi:hypothetical protein
MSRKDIEARLDRSLANQIVAPRLDRSFDAAVWARIEAADAPAAATNPGAAVEPSRALRASRWLAISNAIGIAATLGVVLFFVLRTYGGVEVPMSDVSLSVPVIPEQTVTQVIAVLGQVLGFAALAFGLSFTSLGRRVRASFS